MVREIDPSNAEVAARIVEVQRVAYAVEAELMGFAGIPQLSETVDDVRARTDLRWRGAFDDDLLVGIIGWSEEPDGLDIDRLAVDPAAARRGHGRRLVQSVPTDTYTVVSTGTKNDPALRLYAQEGFEQTHKTEVAPGTFITHLSRHGSA